MPGITNNWLRWVSYVFWQHYPPTKVMQTQAYSPSSVQLFWSTIQTILPHSTWTSQVLLNLLPLALSLMMSLYLYPSNVKSSSKFGHKVQCWFLPSWTLLLPSLQTNITGTTADIPLVDLFLTIVNCFF